MCTMFLPRESIGDSAFSFIFYWGLVCGQPLPDSEENSRLREEKQVGVQSKLYCVQTVCAQSAFINWNPIERAVLSHLL